MSKDKMDIYAQTARFYDYDPRPLFFDDIAFYEDYAEAAPNSEVLELGCGTGRIGLTLAKRGFRVTGLDISPAMLDVFREKLGALPHAARNVEIVEGDMTSFALERSFGLIIMPYRVFQSLVSLKDIHNCLKCVRAHLASGGTFIINAFRPYTVLDENWIYPERVEWEAYDYNVGRKITKYDEGYRIDTANQIIFCRQRYAAETEEGEREESEYLLELRYYYQEQLRTQLEKSGFVIQETYGWYDRSPVGEGRELIFVCE